MKASADGAGSRPPPERIHRPMPSFGIMTAPMQVDYHDILRVWQEADAIPEIEHAWLFDHLLPIGGNPYGPAYEGWTLLDAAAAVFVTSGVAAPVRRHRGGPAQRAHCGSRCAPS